MLPGEDDFDFDYKIQFPQRCILSYCDTPSRASYADWEKHQFVLIKTRSGQMVGSLEVGVIEQALRDIDEFRKSIPSGGVAQYIMLRGLWFDDPHGCVSLYVELLYDYKETPSLTEDQIKKALHHGMGWYDGQIIFVEVKQTPVDPRSDYFSSVSDEYYKTTKEQICW